jgi:hypothetical protein
VSAVRAHISLRPGAAAIVGGGLAVAVLGGCAVVADADRSLLVAVALVLVGLVAWVARAYGPGVIVGLLLLAAVDALPGPNAEMTYLVRTIRLSDGLTALLAVALAWVVLTRPEARRRPGVDERLLRIWAAVVLVLWFVAGVRAEVAHAVPLLNGLFWGRQLLYLPLLAPLFARALSVAQVRQVALVVVAGGICIAAIAQVAAVATSHPVGLLVHLTQLHETEGLVRLYSGASQLIPVGVPFGLGLALFGAARSERLAGAVVCALASAGVVVELTRTLYIALVIGLAVAIALWLLVADAGGRAGRRRLLQVGAVLIAMAGALVVVKPPVIPGSVVNGVIARAASGVAEATGGTHSDPDLVIRTVERRDLLSFLGPSWPFGKGLLDPSYYFVSQVPSGSIQNPDVGYLSAVMTVGVVGTVALYSAFVYLVLRLGYLRLRRRIASSDWLAFGSLAWILMALIASVTVAIMLDPVGAVPSAAVLAIACLCAAGERPSRPAARGA